MRYYDRCAIFAYLKFQMLKHDLMLLKNVFTNQIYRLLDYGFAIGV